MLRFRDLEPHHKEVVCNGCGGKGGKVKPPNFLFEASCDQHDFYYWRGGAEGDREKADKKFYAFMKKDVKRANIVLRPFYYVTAWWYYRAVVEFGKKYFHYGVMKRMKDLLVEGNLSD